MLFGPFLALFTLKYKNVKPDPFTDPFIHDPFTSLSDDDLIQVIDMMKFDIGETEIRVKK